MAITNPSFEDVLSFAGVDRPGVPDTWFISNGGDSWEWGIFDSTIFIGENFEALWGGNEGRRTVFGVGELDLPIFDVTIPESFEDFEEEWGNNEYRRTVFAAGQLTDSTFDAGVPEAFEDFEEEWGGNEGRRTVFGGGELDDAVFQVGVGTGPTERCGDDTNDLNVPVGVAIGSVEYLDITQPNRITFTGTLTGELELQVQRDGFATWETYETITSVPVSVSLPPGYKAVRIEKTVLGGSPVASIAWPVLTAL